MSAGVKQGLAYIFNNIHAKTIADLSSQQVLLTEIITKSLDDPKGLVEIFRETLYEANKNHLVNQAVQGVLPEGKVKAKPDDPEKTSRKIQMFFLFFDALFFNMYSKTKTIESAKLQATLYQSQASMSASQSYDSMFNNVEKKKFIIFLKYFLDCQDIFDELLKIIPKNLPEQYLPNICLQIKTFISTLDYMIANEGIDKRIFAQSRAKFEFFIFNAPETPPIKEHLVYLNRIIFGGDVNKLIKIISLKKNKLANHISLIRILSYYNKDISNKKRFESHMKSGQEMIRRMIYAYFKSKQGMGKDMLFREPREYSRSEPILDFLLNYLAYNYLSVVGTFEEYCAKYLAPLENLQAAEFYNKFNGEPAHKAIELLESLPEDLKVFLRDMHNLLTKAAFTDTKVSSQIPLKTIFIHRFLIGPHLSPARGYFRDLFFDISLKKYADIPEFSKLFDQINSCFQRLLLPSKFINKLLVSKFFITKPIIRYDYTILKQVIDELKIDDISELEDTFEIPEDVKIEPQKVPKDSSQANLTTTTTQSTQRTEAPTQRQIEPQPQKTITQAQPQPQPQAQAQAQQKKVLDQKKLSKHLALESTDSLDMEESLKSGSQSRDKLDVKNSPQERPRELSTIIESPAAQKTEAQKIINLVNLGKEEKAQQSKNVIGAAAKNLAKNETTINKAIAETSLRSSGEGLTKNPATDSTEPKKQSKSNKNAIETAAKNVAGSEIITKSIAETTQKAGSNRSSLEGASIKNVSKSEQNKNPVEAAAKNLAKSEAITKTIHEVSHKSQQGASTFDVAGTKSKSDYAQRQSQSEFQQQNPVTKKTQSTAVETLAKNIASKPQLITGSGKQQMGITKTISTDSRNQQKMSVIEEGGGQDDNGLMSFEVSLLNHANVDKENPPKWKVAEMEQSKERSMLLNKINILEEKYQMVLDSLTNVLIDRDKRNSVLDDARMITQNMESSRFEINPDFIVTPQKYVGDDDFYTLTEEINRARDEALKAEVEYIMHKRIYFPEEFRDKNE